MHVLNANLRGPGLSSAAIGFEIFFASHPELVNTEFVHHELTEREAPAWRSTINSTARQSFFLFDLQLQCVTVNDDERTIRSQKRGT